MNTFTHTSKSILTSIFVLVLAVGFAACDDNPVADDNDNDDEHAEVEGLLMEVNGAEVFRVLEGEVSCAQSPCGVSVAAGDETPLISVEFLDHDGDHIHGEDLGDDFSLGFEIEDESIAEFEQHAEDGKWNFHIHGEQSGETKMQLQLLHVGHADFTTPPLSNENAITITVTQ